MENIMITSSHEFESYVRQQTINIPGPCVLDLCKENALQCSGFSSFESTQTELQIVLSNTLLWNVLDACQRYEVEKCFIIRNELVNYKKLCLHMYHHILKIDASLRRYCSLFFCDIVNTPQDDPSYILYTDLSAATMYCKGHSRTLLDIREMGKYICSIPRHPDLDETCYPSALSALPDSLGIHGLISKAEEFVTENFEYDLQYNSVESDEHMPTLPPQSTSSITYLSYAPLTNPSSTFLDLLSSIYSIDAMPYHVAKYVELCLVARGVYKAMRIRTALSHFHQVLRDLSVRVERLIHVFSLPSVVNHHVTAEKGNVKHRIRCDMHRNVMEGIVPILQASITAIHLILTAPDKKIFSAGDGKDRGLMCTLEGTTDATAGVLKDMFICPRVITCSLSMADQHYQDLLSNSSFSWPPQPSRSGRYIKAKATHECHICHHKFAKLWVTVNQRDGHRCVCMQCERISRAQGKCPWIIRLSETCETNGHIIRNGHKTRRKCPGASVWCVHQNACLVCDGSRADETSCGTTGCSACGLVYCNGEGVLDLTERMKSLRWVFLDFDSTLATTKRGENPLIGYDSTQCSDNEGVAKRSGDTISRKVNEYNGAKKITNQVRHTVDLYLRELCNKQAAGKYSVHVVTRNSHLDDIKRFLVLEGCFANESEVNVHVVSRKLGLTKWDAIRSVMHSDMGSDTSTNAGHLIMSSAALHNDDTHDELEQYKALFVDDTQEELLGVDDTSGATASKRCVLRVLFSSGGIFSLLSNSNTQHWAQVA